MVSSTHIVLILIIGMYHLKWEDMFKIYLVLHFNYPFVFHFFRSDYETFVRDLTRQFVQHFPSRIDSYMGSTIQVCIFLTTDFFFFFLTYWLQCLLPLFYLYIMLDKGGSVSSIFVGFFVFAITPQPPLSLSHSLHCYYNNNFYYFASVMT